MESGAWTWEHLNTQRLGRWAEYFVKMTFTQAGFDVYTPEVDDRGLDFVVRAGPGRYYEVQVKSGRIRNTYVFMRKSHFQPTRDLHLALVLFVEGESPEIFLIPSTVWLKPVEPFVSRDYGTRMKSAPEWGLKLTRAGRTAIGKYRFDLMAQRLRHAD